MNMNDEELQRDAEHDRYPDEMDSRAYKFVFDALRKEPDYKLSPAFADRVVKVAQGKQKGFSSEILWIGLGVFLLLIAFVVTIVMTGFKLNLGLFSGMSSYYGLFIFGSLFIGLLNFIDKKMLRKSS
jgi:hypothetical protein